jgi:hypothetical protein
VSTAGHPPNAGPRKYSAFRTSLGAEQVIALVLRSVAVKWRHFGRLRHSDQEFLRQ